MRRLIAGLSHDGTSCVVKEGAISFNEVQTGVGLDVVFETEESPPPSRPEGRGDLLPLGVEPGLVRWMVMDWSPGTELPNHHTDTVDFDTVIAGSVELILEDGSHSLNVGDCVVLTGVDHMWRAGPEGCRISCICLGTPPRS